MNLNRFLPIGGVVIAGVLLVAFLGCTKSSLRERSLRFDKTSQSPPLLESVANANSTIWHDSFEAAQAASASSGKPILADFTGSDWCQWCVKLKADVFEKEEFERWARQNVILLELDYPRQATQPPAIKQQNAELSKRYNIRGYPTVLFLTSNGDVLGKLGYEKDPATWIRSAQAILAK